MLAILDPCLFDLQHPIDSRTLDGIVRLLRRSELRIPSVHWYWKPLHEQFIVPLRARTLDPIFRAHLDALRDWTRHVVLPERPARYRVRGFKIMFEGLGVAWWKDMKRLVVGCVLTGEQTFLVTRLNARNARIHRYGHVVCHEKTCWNLRVRPEGQPLTRVLCICTPRNFAIPWTCRYDDRLPATEDGAKFPFCPAPAWEVEDNHNVFVTSGDKKVWLDAHENGWAKPSTGDGHHWDVYLAPGIAEEYGLSQLNIVAWGAPPKEKRPGDIHHIPKEKKGRLKKHTGWTC